MTVDPLIQWDSELLLRLAHSATGALVILAAGFGVLLIIRRAIRFLEAKPVLSPPLVVLLATASRWIVYTATVLLILQQVGISLNHLWTVISAMVAMVAIGFVAVWSVLSNLLCTVILLIFQPFSIGDEIEVVEPGTTTGLHGKVRNINLLFTTIQSTTDDPMEAFLIQVPNNQFFQKIIKRRDGSRAISLDKQLFEEKSLLSDSNHLYDR
ncbi:MAG: mechanosensitive ion channel [Desulfobacterales bacterium]|jgi:small-conductance mechanosensitive channel